MTGNAKLRVGIVRQSGVNRTRRRNLQIRTSVASPSPQAFLWHFANPASVSRLASVFALWVLLGFVLGGLGAPMLHVVQHTTECAHADGHHAHAEHSHGEASLPGHLSIVAAEDSEPGCLACALCAVQLTSTSVGAESSLEAPCARGDLGSAVVSVPDSPTATLYAPRGPPAC